MDAERSLSLISRLPHKPPMRMVEEVIKAASSEAVCALIVDQAFCERWGDREGADPYFAIEFAAQTAAIAIGCEDDAIAQQSGMLVQVREFAAKIDRVTVGSKVECRAKVDVGLEGSFAMARCEVVSGSELVCEVQLSIAIGQ